MHHRTAFVPKFTPVDFWNCKIWSQAKIEEQLRPASATSQVPKNTELQRNVFYSRWSHQTHPAPLSLASYSTWIGRTQFTPSIRQWLALVSIGAQTVSMTTREVHRLKEEKEACVLSRNGSAWSLSISCREAVMSCPLASGSKRSLKCLCSLNTDSI